VPQACSAILFRPLFEKELLDMSVEQFLTSLRFEKWGKLEKLSIKLITSEYQQPLSY